MNGDERKIEKTQTLNEYEVSEVLKALKEEEEVEKKNNDNSSKSTD